MNSHTLTSNSSHGSLAGGQVRGLGGAGGS